MEALNIDKIKQFVNEGNLRWTNHIIIRLLQRNITLEDIEMVLLNGEIIENYEDDYPYPSCLILGVNKSNEYIHIVCGLNDTELWLITAYYPDKSEWENDLKTRKENK